MRCDECGLSTVEWPALVKDCLIDVCPHQKNKDRVPEECVRCRMIVTDQLQCMRADCPHNEVKVPSPESKTFVVWEMTNDPVNHPSHYNQGGVEVIDVIEAFELGYCAGNTIKYILRHRFKINPLEDLKKARWYLERLIQQHEKGDSDEQER